MTSPRGCPAAGHAKETKVTENMADNLYIIGQPTLDKIEMIKRRLFDMKR